MSGPILTINPYREYVNLLKEGKLSPDDIDIDTLIKEFKEKVKEFDYYSLYLHSAMFLEAISRLVKLKADAVYSFLTPQTEEEEQERKRYIRKQVEEILKEYDLIEDEELQELFTSYRRKTGRKTGTKIGSVNRMSYEQFKDMTTKQVKEVLFEDVDYREYAKRIASEIKKGTFKIRSFRDFIGLMFAITFEGIEIENIEKFVQR